MKYLAITLLALTINLTSTQLFAQFSDSSYSDSSYVDTMYDQFDDMDSTYQDEEPGTVKEILNEGAQSVGEMGKQTLNNLTNKASYEAGQFLNRQADKLVNGIKQKLSGKNKNKSSEKDQQSDKIADKKDGSW